jgi:TPR repeat protein
MVMKMMRKIFCVTLLALLTLGAQGQNNLQPDANYWAGTKYLYKAKTVADLNQAYRYFSKSAQSGHLMGQVMIGYCYELGIMVKKNVEKAKEIYYSAAGKGCFLGYRYLGFYYRHVKDYVKSMVFYAKAANWEGDPCALWRCGVAEDARRRVRRRRVDAQPEQRVVLVQEGER